MRLEKTLLVAGIALPILYFANVLGSSLFYPGYSHVTQYASEMGSSSATYPAVFNTGVMVVGVAALVAGAGFFLTLRRLSTNFVLSLLVGLFMLLFGISFIMAGIFPMPDERHNAYNIYVGIHLVPFLLVVALWKYRSLRPLTLFILVNGVFFLALFAVMMGVGGLVRLSNVGIWQRTYAFFMMLWIGVASYALRRYLDSVPVDQSASATRAALASPRSIR